MPRLSAAHAIRSLIERHTMPGGGQLNEAATRLELVNEILKDILDWTLPEFHPEEHASGTDPATGKRRNDWLDYHLRRGETTRLVVEAKRAGATFSLPTSRKQRKTNLDTLATNHGEALSKAIRQARRYCVKVGTYAFAVTNGTQWIVSLAFAHNVAADKIEALVFYDLEDIEANLSEFIDLISPQGLAAQVLMTRAVAGGNIIPPFARRLNDVHMPRAPSTKNYLSQPISALMRTCFGDLTDVEHRDMLQRCYVSNEVSNGYMQRLESFVGTTLPQPLAVIASKVDRQADSASRFESAARATGEAVLLVGRAGSGKSTFIAITKARLSLSTGTQYVLLHVDLSRKTQIHAAEFEHDRLIDEVCHDLITQAESLYPALNPFEHKLLAEVFSGEIGRLRASLSEASRNSVDFDKRADELIQEHLKRPLNHLKAYLGFLDRRDIRALLFIDNVDRGTEQFERVIVQLAKTLAQHTRATIVTSLRDTTYQSGKTAGFLDVGRDIAFIISPPAFADVANLRFEYVRTRLRDDAQLSRIFLRACAGTPPDSVFQFSETLSDIVLGDNPQIQSCIQALAGTNIRKALDFLEDFATSPNTDLDKLFSLVRRSTLRGKPEVGPSLDIFLRSVMRVSADRYSEKDSKILNLFQVLPTVLCSHFDSIRILQLLRFRLSGGTRESNNMNVEGLLSHMGSIGHHSLTVGHALEHLGNYGLVISLSKPEPPWSLSDVVRLGAAGRYYLEELVLNREYIQGLVDDTVIYDEEAFATLNDIQRDKLRSWPQKLEEKRATFLRYLIRREDSELTGGGAPRARPPWLQSIADVVGQQQFGVDFVRTARAAASRRKH